MLESIFSLLITTAHVIMGGICFVTIFIIVCFGILLAIASAIQSTILIADEIRTRIKIRRTNGNKIRRMNDKQMAQYFLQNYTEIELYKGRFCGLEELEKWLGSKED